MLYVRWRNFGLFGKKFHRSQVFLLTAVFFIQDRSQWWRPLSASAFKLLYFICQFLSLSSHSSFYFKERTSPAEKETESSKPSEQKKSGLSSQSQSELVKSLADQVMKEMNASKTADEETKRLATLETRFRVKKDSLKTKFSDIVGHDEIKKELQGIAKLLKNPKQFADMGVTLPKGCLLSGSCGVGKTMIARAFAGR